ncbi:MAG: HNH endonuclease [Romboutsia timonensis]|uniref:HNH endonuclease n=1 Tax=Romboutsia timonensis TaxID=1776391 RepID=UPI002A75A9D9|nr:HNH endonuclease [Romboutsia timonensis]MDY3001827.1 HNH endonuclease [Romboutsia timonensis]
MKRKSKKILEIESKYNMEYKDILTKLYLEECKSLPIIAKELGCDAGNLSRQLKKMGIPARNNKEAFKNWWNTTDDKETFLNNSRKIGNTVLKDSKNREKLKSIMQTSEYKRKISKANRGKKNGMHKEELSEEHRVKTRGIFGYKQWSRQVRERDNHTCQVCGLHTKEPNKLHAHHLESYDTHPKLRLELSNGITICNSCHNSFHNRHKGEKTTKKQFIEFQADKCL